MVWDREDYIAESDRQLKDNKTYESGSFKDVDLIKLIEKSNSILQSLRKRKLITEEELKYFTYKYQKVTNFGKMYLLSKIYKRLVDVPGRLVISNCGTPTEKDSKFLDLQPIMKSSTSYIKSTNDFLSKHKYLKKVPDNAMLVTADVVGLYPSIPHNEGLEVLEKQLRNFYKKSVPTEDLVKMAEFVLKNNYFEFNSNVKHQISETDIGTKFTQSYVCIYIDYMGNQFLKNEQIQSWVWFRYIYDIFFIWTASEKELDEFLERLNNFHLSSSKFTHERPTEEISFLDVTVRVNHGEFITNLYCKPTDGHQYLHLESCYPSHTKSSIIFSQALRMKRICSKKSDLLPNVGKLKDWFKEKGYPEDMVN